MWLNGRVEHLHMHSGLGAGAGFLPDVIPRLNVIGGLHCKACMDQGALSGRRFRFGPLPSVQGLCQRHALHHQPNADNKSLFMTTSSKHCSGANIGIYALVQIQRVNIYSLWKN